MVKDTSVALFSLLKPSIGSQHAVQHTPLLGPTVAKGCEMLFPLSGDYEVCLLSCIIR